MSQKLITVVGATGQQRRRRRRRLPAQPGLQDPRPHAEPAQRRRARARGLRHRSRAQQHGAQKAKEVEAARGAAMARAAAAVPGLEHYVWSTLPRGVPSHPVYHFDSKHDVEALAAMRPYRLAEGRYVQFTTYPEDTAIPFIGDVA
ncbi:NAD(P)-binding domain protein [Cordyceps fumosorosea ARSEF 2679]|uniref:NAD(P)-binding domain protein n=1 Tax=Cordyceps fumosorosea (strain ARSEF 2679) TaxID=1081104 RepID=A0A167TMF8_CORFA|nr:NAD(P)-binding domain protein [Cordyceps fumosorosea ARSEF 2679]OAA60749.1 NAD(P)-binding domain protein [Cordyceps fumosorosea ARSEF 2679]